MNTENIREYKRLENCYAACKTNYEYLLFTKNRNKTKKNNIKRAMDNYFYKMNRLYKILSDEEKLYVELED